VANKFLLLLF